MTWRDGEDGYTVGWFDGSNSIVYIVIVIRNDEVLAFGHFIYLIDGMGRKVGQIVICVRLSKCGRTLLLGTQYLYV